MTARLLCLRHEFKYKIDRLQFDVLKKNLAKVLKPDPHMGAAGQYHVRSLYFDDFRNSAFWEKQAGVYSRDKYRIRIYHYSDDMRNGSSPRNKPIPKITAQMTSTA
ncbi:MAG: VTC domain-containing protein, partial [Candidatus Bathyarchaeia archaeon]